MVVCLVAAACCVCGLIRVSRDVRARAERKVIKERLRMEVSVFMSVCIVGETAYSNAFGTQVMIARKHGLWQVDDEADAGIQGLRERTNSAHDTDGL